MDEGSHSTRHYKRRGIKVRRKRKYAKQGQRHVRVSIGSLHLCTQDHIAPQRTNDRDEPASSGKVKLERLLMENDHYLDFEDSDDEDRVKVFMTNGNRIRPPWQAESIKAFCRSETLQELTSNSRNLSSKKTCLVDDIAIDGTKSTRLEDLEPLTTWEFYQKLNKEVSL